MKYQQLASSWKQIFPIKQHVCGGALFRVYICEGF